jgi:hypothetical protein
MYGGIKEPGGKILTTMGITHINVLGDPEGSNFPLIGHTSS